MEGAILCKNKGHGTVKYHLKEIELTFPNFYFGQQIDAVISHTLDLSYTEIWMKEDTL